MHQYSFNMGKNSSLTKKEHLEKIMKELNISERARRTIHEMYDRKLSKQQHR